MPYMHEVMTPELSMEIALCSHLGIKRPLYTAVYNKMRRLGCGPAEAGESTRHLLGFLAQATAP